MKNFKYLIILILLSFPPLVTLFNPGLPVTHDGQDHVARIANFYLSLTEGNLIPRWAGNLNWGYGHPILMFLYPMPSYLASLFHFLGASLVDSVKIVFGVSYILSAIFMFLWIRSFLGKFPALVGSVIFIYAPYRFVDLYVRGAIGEHVAFIFLPAICYFLYKLNKEKKFNYLYFLGLGISTAFLILSHNAISLMFLPFIVFYSGFLFWQHREKLLLIASVFGIFYGFLLSSFFWIPAFAEGKYTLRDIVTNNEALSRFVSFKDLIFGSWNYGGTGSFTIQLGIIPWIFILISPICLYILYKRKKEKSILQLLILTSIFFLISIFIMLNSSIFIWEKVTILQKFQFPWRFLSLSIFLTAIISSIAVYCVNSERLKALIFVITLILSMILTKDYWKANSFLEKPESFYSGIYESTTDTGESAPVWSVRFMEESPQEKFEIIEGSAQIRELSRNSTSRSYEIIVSESARMKENTLYFPGWKVYVDGAEEKNIEFQDPNNRGLMTFTVLPGKHIVNIKFEDTRLRMVSNLITILSIAGLVVIGFGARRKR